MNIRNVLVVFAAIVCSAGTAKAGFMVYGGATIGNDSSTTDGNGLITAGGANTQPAWNWPLDNGTPSFLYTSDGKSGFQQLRAVVGAIPQPGGLNWSQYNWTVDVWTKSGYLSKSAPVTTVNMGAEPSNWSGFQTISVTHVIPNTTPFGTPVASNPGLKSYEMVFDLSGHPSLQALAPGDYVVSLTSRHSSASDGLVGVGGTFNGIGPTPYYSQILQGIQPTAVYPTLSTNANLRWGMELSIENDFANGSFDSGLTGWGTQGPGQVDLFNASGNNLVQFTAGSPATLSQWLITENQAMSLSFDLYGLQNSGLMSLFFGTDFLGSYDPSLFFNEWKTFNVDLSDSLYWGRHDQLKFVWDGTTGDQAWLDNVNYSATSSAVPEPASLAMWGLGAIGLIFARRKRKQQTLAV